MLQNLQDPDWRSLSPPGCRSSPDQADHPGAHLDLLDAAALLGLPGAPDGNALLAVVAEPAVRPQTLVSEGQEVRVVRDLHLHAGRCCCVAASAEQHSPAGQAADDVTGRRVSQEGAADRALTRTGFQKAENWTRETPLSH